MLLHAGVHPESQEKIERKISCKRLVPVTLKKFEKCAIEFLVLFSLQVKMASMHDNIYIKECQMHIRPIADTGIAVRNLTSE